MIQKLQDSRAVLLGAVAIFAIGLTTSGYALGDGLRRSKMAEHRTVSVRGVSERNVTADLATWSVEFSHQGDDLGPVQQSVDEQARAVRAFFQRAGFKPEEIADTDVSLGREQQRDNAGQPVGPQKPDRQPLDPAEDQRRDEGAGGLYAPGGAASRRSRAFGQQHHLHLHRPQ